MICSRCLYRSAVRPSSQSVPSLLRRTFTTSPSRHEPAAATSTLAAQPFSTPLSPSPNDVSLGAHLRPKIKNPALPVSSCAAGTTLKGLNYLKGRDDPVALAEEEYPEWLWRCLEAKVKEGEGDVGEGDAFCKFMRNNGPKRVVVNGHCDAYTALFTITTSSFLVLSQSLKQREYRN